MSRVTKFTKFYAHMHSKYGDNFPYFLQLAPISMGLGGGIGVAFGYLMVDPGCSQRDKRITIFASANIGTFIGLGISALSAIPFTTSAAFGTTAGIIYLYNGYKLLKDDN